MATGQVEEPMAKGSVWQNNDEDDEEEYESSEEDFDEENMTAREQLTAYAQRTLRYLHNNKEVADLLWHIIMLALITGIALNVDSSFELLEQNESIRSAIAERTFASVNGGGLMTFRDIGTVSDFWLWCRGPFLGMIASNTFPDTPGFFGRYMRVLGTVRFRQLRVTKGRGGCNVPGFMKDYSTDCYPPYSAEAEDVSAYGPVSVQTGLPTWRWRTASELDEGWFVGRASEASYAGSGFNFTMPLVSSDAVTALKFYEEKNWIDLSTRALFIDFIVYNANIGMLTLCKILVELPSSGGIVAHVVLYSSPVKMLLPSESSSVMLAAEITLIVLVSSSILVELNAIRRDRWNYWKDPWHWFDALNFISFVAAFILRLQPFYIMTIRGFPPPPDAFVNYNTAMWAVAQWRNVIALNVLLAWLRLFKALRFIPFLRLFMGVLGRAFLQVLPFCIVFILVLWTFGIAHRLAFGSEIREYRTVLQSMFSLQRIILGSEDFDRMWDVNRILGPLFFFSWTLVGYFVLANMFVAILVESISNDKVRAIPHIGVADSARGAYHRWQIWQAQTAEEKRLKAVKAEAKATRLPGFNVKKRVEDEHADDALVAAKKREAEERLKSMSRKGVKEVEVTSADVGIVEGRLNGILNSLHKLRGTLQERDDTRRQKAEQAELTRQWEEMQKTQRQAERDSSFASRQPGSGRRPSMVMSATPLAATVGAPGMFGVGMTPLAAAGLTPLAATVGGNFAGGSGHGTPKGSFQGGALGTPRGAAAGGNTPGGSAVNLGGNGGLYLGGRR